MWPKYGCKWESHILQSYTLIYVIEKKKFGIFKKFKQNKPQEDQ